VTERDGRLVGPATRQLWRLHSSPFVPQQHNPSSRNTFMLPKLSCHGNEHEAREEDAASVSGYTGTL